VIVFDASAVALAAGADAIISGDADLLVLHPWRGVRILRPADYLAEVRGGA
jgi:predicted nucleic acid-binding protein